VKRYGYNEEDRKETKLPQSSFHQLVSPNS